MRLRHALILALLLGASGAVLLGFDLNRRLVLAGAGLETGSALAQSRPLLQIGAPYLIALIAIAVANLAALLLLLSAFREERTTALLRARQGSGAPPPAAPRTEASSEAASGRPAIVSEEPPWGTLSSWKRCAPETQRALQDLWNRSCKDLYQAVPMERGTLEKFLGSREFDASSSALALSKDGVLVGAVLALRQPQFEDDGYWWLKSPGVIAAVLVDEARRRQGVGRALIRYVEAAAQKRRRPSLFVGGLENFPHLLPGVPAQDHGARIFFTALGYREVRRTCHMEAEYHDYQPPRELLEREEKLKESGYRFAPAQAGDEEAFQVFLDASHLDRPQRRMERFRANVEHFYLVWKDHAIAGFIQVTEVDEQGHSGIRLIYFLREHRGGGLGSVLLVKAHELWKKMGAKGGSIWTYPEAAARFYPRAGFKTVQEWICYEKDLPHSWDDEDFVKRWR